MPEHGFILLAIWMVSWGLLAALVTYTGKGLADAIYSLIFGAIIALISTIPVLAVVAAAEIAMRLIQ